MTSLQILAKITFTIGIILYIISRANKEEGYGYCTIYSIVFLLFSIASTALDGFLTN